MLLSANETVPVDVLAEQLWPEHTLVGRLRKLLDPGMISTQRGDGYLLIIDAIDVHRFRGLLARARVAEDSGPELSLLREALALWRGTPFVGINSDWLDREVTPRLTEEWFGATGRRIELELDAGPPEALIPELRPVPAQ